VISSSLLKSRLQRSRHHRQRHDTERVDTVPLTANDAGFGGLYGTARAEDANGRITCNDGITGAGTRPFRKLHVELSADNLVTVQPGVEIPLPVNGDTKFPFHHRATIRPAQPIHGVLIQQQDVTAISTVGANPTIQL
jgi:hypothetical protein